MASIQNVSIGIVLFLLLVSIAAPAFNSEAISEIRIKLNPGVAEKFDKKLPLLSQPGGELPDYRLEYLVAEKWQVIGTKHNQSASEWLAFPVNDPPSLALVKGVRVVEDDIAKDDILDEVSPRNGQVDGTMFSFEFQTSSSYKAGLDWYASTALGKAILGAIFLAVFLVVISRIG